MDEQEGYAAVIVRVVRGEAPLTALATIGIVPHCSSDGLKNRLTFDNPRRLRATFSLRNLATGLLAAHPEAGYAAAASRRRWTFVLMACDFADLHPHDETADEPLPVEAFVLDTLWDASFGNPIDAETRRRLATIAHGDFPLA